MHGSWTELDPGVVVVTGKAFNDDEGQDQIILTRTVQYNVLQLFTTK